MVNKCAVAGLVFGALASIIAVLEGTLKAFVDVFIAEESGDDAALSCKIAGLGVYTTEYDSSCLSPERLASSRVPSEQFTAPTTSFKLLFPAQENFVAEVLPVNDEVLSLFEGADVLVGPALAEVTDLEFSSCQQYMTDAQTGLEDLFGVLNDQFLPLLVPLVIGEAATAVSGGITQIGAVTNVAPGAANAFTNIFASTFDFAKGALVAAGQAGVCPVVGKALTDAFDATDYTCLQNGYAGFATTVTGALPGFFNDLAGVMGGCAAAPPAVGFACYASIQSNFGDNGLLAPVTGTFCDDFSICTQDIQKFQAFGQLAGFVGQLAALVAANGADPASLLSLAQGLGGMQLFGAAFAPTLAGLGQAGTNAQIGALLASATTTVGATFPTTFTAPYVPCELLQIAQAGLGLDLDAIPNLGQVCSFGSFFDGAAALAAATGDDLAALVGQLAFLYDICRDNPAFSSPQDCDLFYPSLFMNAAYQSEMQEGFLTLSPANTSPVFDLGVLACADDEVDKEKIGEAQTFLGASIALYFVAALFGGFSMAVERHSKTFALAFATILGIVAVALNFGALLTVRSAPVYESVGEPAVEDEPVYKEGLVVKLALMAALLQVVSCVCYTVAACVNHRSIDREEAAGDNTAKEVEVEKAELAVAEKAEA